MLQIVALVSLVIFSILMLGIGLLTRKKASTMEGFLLGGRNVGPWISAFSYGTTYFSAVLFIGYAGMHGWNIGIASIWIGVGNAIVGCLLAWMVLAKPTRRMTHNLQAKTMPEFFAARYKSVNMKLYTAVIIFLFLVPYAASVYKGLGVMFSIVFPGISSVVCMLIVAILTAVYLVLGGYVATAWNDLIQGGIMILGMVIMVVTFITRPEVNGLAEGLSRLSDINPSLVSVFGGSNIKFLITNIMLTSLGVWGLPQMVHKYYAIKDESSIPKATIVSTIFASLIGCGAYFIGSMSHLFIPAAANGTPDLAGGFDSIIPTMLTTVFSGSLLSNIVLSLILLTLLSASMSTLASVVLTSSSAISVDILKTFRPDISNKRQMLIMRLLCFLFVGLSFTFATMNISFIVNLMSFSWGIVAGSFIGPFIWGLFSKRTTRAGAWAGVLSGFVVVMGLIIFKTATVDFNAAKSLAPEFGVTAMLVSLAIVPIVSRFTKTLPQEHIDHVFTYLPAKKS